MMAAYENIPDDAMAVIIRIMKVMPRHHWRLTHVHDGEVKVPVVTPSQALGIIDSVEMSTLIFEREGRRAYIELAPGNGADVVVDHTDRPDFTPIIDRVMEEVGE